MHLSLGVFTSRPQRSTSTSKNVQGILSKKKSLCIASAADRECASGKGKGRDAFSPYTDLLTEGGFLTDGNYREMTFSVDFTG